MTGRIIYEPKRPHDCNPGSTGITHLASVAGSVWRCDECRDTWTWWPSASLSQSAVGGWVRDLHPDPGIQEEGAPLWPWFYVMCAVIVGAYVLFVVMTL